MIPVVLFFSLIVFNLYYLHRIYPNTLLAGTEVGGKTKNETVLLLSRSIKTPDKLTLQAEEERFEIPLATIDFYYEFSQSFDRAFSQHRCQGFWQLVCLKPLSLRPSNNLPLSFVYDQEKFNHYFESILNQTLVPSVYPKVRTANSQVYVTKGTSGKAIDRGDLLQQIGTRLALADSSPITAKVDITNISLFRDQELLLYNRANKLLTKNLKLTLEDNSLTWQKQELLDLLNYQGGYQTEALEAIIQKAGTTFTRKAQNPVFVFTEGRVTEFAPAKDGIEVKNQQLKEALITALTQLENGDNLLVSLEVPVTRTPPEYSTGDVNSLGIKELLGRGVSRFIGSLPARIFNITLASSKLNGVLVKPNETVSFNALVGDATKENGFQEAYIIKEGKTELGDGGGVCQVSTTLFRAVLNSGLPVTERRAHSYRVAYYEQGFPPGIDATTYYPTTDLKFVNNTPAHLLIQTRVDKKTATLTFEIYGTSDGRVSDLTKPVVTDSTPPPEDLYIDDPTLPIGTIKQIDWKAWGAKVSFTYTVKRNTETIYQKTFKSDYQPWQAKYLRGTGAFQ